MPEILRARGYRFFFYSKENDEPPHVHVEQGGSRAKVWLEPVALATQRGFNTKELNWIQRFIEKNEQLFRQRWDEHFQAGS